MKIQLLGTGNITSVKNSASILINEHILFDMPNGNFKAMLRQNVDINKIDTVIISHTHADHCFDLPFLLWYKKNNAIIEESTKIITDSITKETIENLVKLTYFKSAIEAKKEFIDVSKISEVRVCENLNITNEPMKHGKIEHANGYRIEEKNFSIGLTGDTGFCKGVENLASKVNYLILDMTLEVGNDSHMGIDNILELMNKYPNLKIVPVHMRDKTREEAKKLKRQNLMILEDGEILEIF